MHSVPWGILPEGFNLSIVQQKAVQLVNFITRVNSLVSTPVMCPAGCADIPASRNDLAMQLGKGRCTGCFHQPFGFQPSRAPSRFQDWQCQPQKTSADSAQVPSARGDACTCCLLQRCVADLLACCLCILPAYISNADDRLSTTVNHTLAKRFGWS